MLRPPRPYETTDLRKDRPDNGDVDLQAVRDGLSQLEPGTPTPMPGVCRSCNQAILIQIYQGTGYCSDNCRKALAKVPDPDVGRY